MIKVAFNSSPLSNAHKTRGVGSYTRSLLEKLKVKDGLEVIEFSNISSVKGADLVHYPWYDLFFRTLTVNNIPTIVTIHDVMPLVFPEQHPIGIKGRINFFLQRIALSRCKYIITISETSKKDIIKYLKISGEKIVVIPEAANEKFKVLSSSGKIRIKNKLRLPEKYILYVGDANFVKNLPVLISSFNELSKKNEYKDVNLVLVNGVFLKKVDDIDHPELISLKTVNKLISENKLKERVLRLGQVDLEDLVGIYNLATVYVQPSLYEGFGLPILEAFACGCPVISSNAASLPEVGGDAAVYFDPRNVSQLTRILNDVLEDKSLQNKLSNIGLNQAKKFSWERVADETIKVYQSALGK